MDRQAEEDIVAALPDDVLADVLRRLAPRCLAASRCVRRSWRDVIDGRRLLRADLLPRSLAGIFINFHCVDKSELFARPSKRPAISGDLNYLPCSSGIVEDHCNGLILLSYHDYVVNPATRWWAALPPRPPSRNGEYTFRPGYLAFDPAVSPHYEVLLVPTLDHKPERGDPCYIDPIVERSEWPPLSYALDVFTSRTGQWEERTFLREGQAAGTIGDIRSDWPSEQRNAVYWRGELYVHCQGDFFMRISLASGKYRVIKPPEVPREEGKYLGFYLGKSQKGVYLAFSRGFFSLHVWILDESYGQAKWVLKHDKYLKHVLARNNQQARGTWILQNINSGHEDDDSDNMEDECDTDHEAPIDGKFEWSSDDDSVLDNNNENVRAYHGYIDVIGFHPYKEILFLGESMKRGLAYYLNSSKVEDLGNLYPACYNGFLSNEEFINESFPYTPCWM